MENLKTRQINRNKLFRTIDNKRTISSEQGQYQYQKTQNPRKFTIEYLDPKKSIRQPLIPRKNQSLPRTLTNNSQNSIQHNIRSRKLLYTSVYNDQKSSNKTIPTHGYSSQPQHKIDYNKSKEFCEAISLYTAKKYQEALHKFLQVEKEAKDNFVKNIYYIGLSYCKLGSIEKAVFYLSKALDFGYQFSTETYDMLSTFYESTKNYNCALKTLDHWLKVEISSKAYLMRARIYFLFKEYSKAIVDYGECYKIEPTKLEAYIEEAEATYRQNGLQSAIQKYTHLLLNYNRIWPESQHSDINYVKYKKSLLLLQQKKYEQALALLTQVTNVQLQSEVGYYIGIIYSVLNDFQSAALAFSRSIQSNTSQKFVGQSYYQKFVLMFKKNDYYGIQYQLDIIRDKYSDNQALQVLKSVIEGIIYILKMHFNQGIKIFQMLQNNPIYLKNLKIYSFTVSSFKIFAFYSMYNFQEAYEQFNQIKNKKMSESNRYNFNMLKAMRSAQSKDYNEALQLFAEAEKIEPFNNHTFMVKAIVEIFFYNSLLECDKKEEYNANQQILLSAEQLLNRCLQKQNENDQILYILAAINYELSQYESGLKLIRKAIDASDDHTIKHYYLKANLKIMMEMHPQAISDYTNAILVMNEQENAKKEQIQQNQRQIPIYECYLERAKCYIMEGNLQKAEADLRIFFSQLQMVKKYERDLDLFMHVGCSDVILDIYKSILEEQYDLYEKMKCYYLAKQLNNCLNMMNALLQFEAEQSDEERHYDLQKLSVDRDCLQALKKSSQGSTFLIQQALNIFQQKLQSHVYGDIFKKADCMFYSGVMSFLLQDYGKAKNYFIDAKSEKLQLNQISKNQIEQDMNLENQLFSFQEINYNIGICDFIQGKWSTYLDEYSEFKKHHQSVTQNLLIEEPEQITPFIVKNRLCSIYPPEKMGNVSYRLSFCLPKIRLREVKFTKNQQIIRSITIKDIDMRPSAPWIQKSKKGIIFTTDILKESVDLKSEKSKRGNNGKKKAQQRYKDQEQN